MRLKIVVCPDSFKGSISAKDACDAIEKGLVGADVLKVPIADGGEGTCEALADEFVYCDVTGPDGDMVRARYGMRGSTAVIEMAEAAGLPLTKKRQAALATSYGVGELIGNALSRGCRDIMLTVGGSATNDGGCGMLCALGARFYNNEGEFIPTGGTLADIERIDISGLDRRLEDVKFRALTDVKNPLVGSLGATYVYGRQKGADDNALLLMERGMVHFADILYDMSGKYIADLPGAGAGGGLVAPLIAFCDITLASGIDAVLDTLGFDALIDGADIIVTGEGRIDVQSLYGKAISGVARRAAKRNIPVYCLVGAVGDDRQKLRNMGIADIYALADIAPDADYSMSHAAELLTQNAATMLANIIDKSTCP